MCHQSKCARFMLYFYVLCLWALFPFIFNLCNHLLEVDTCLEYKHNLPCEECFNYDYSWRNVAVALTAIYTCQFFAFTVVCLYILVNRYRNWRYGALNSQLYNRMTG